MAQEASASDRIDGALARIEAVSLARVEAAATLERRHAALRTKMAEAVAALDALIERGDRD